MYRDGRQIASSLTGNFFAHLEAGSYTAVIRHGDATEERAFTVQDETDLSYDLPRRNSAAPLWGSVDTHETISEVVKHASTTIGKGVACGAFIVFRSKDSLTVPKGRDRFRIMDIGPKEGAGEPITFIELPPGMTMITHQVDENDCVQFWIPLAQGWHTFVFVPVQNESASLPKASVLMRPAGTGFDPTDALLNAYELALGDLVSGGIGPGPHLMDDLANGKFENPLFGLVAAHFLLRDLDPSKERTFLRVSPTFYRLSLIVANLAKLAGDDFPDVVALRLALGQPAGVETVARVPFLRASMLVLIHATADNLGLLPDIFDPLIIHADLGSPWNVARIPPRAETVLVTHGAGQQDIAIRARRSYRLDAVDDLLRSNGYHVSKTIDDEHMHHIQAWQSDEFPLVDQRTLERFFDLPDAVVETVRDELARKIDVDRTIRLKRLVRRLNLPMRLVEVAAQVIGGEIAPGTLTQGERRSTARFAARAA